MAECTNTQIDYSKRIICCGLFGIVDWLFEDESFLRHWVDNKKLTSAITCRMSRSEQISLLRPVQSATVQAPEFGFPYYRHIPVRGELLNEKSCLKSKTQTNLAQKYFRSLGSQWRYVCVCHTMTMMTATRLRRRPRPPQRGWHGYFSSSPAESVWNSSQFQFRRLPPTSRTRESLKTTSAATLLMVP